jgi:hypothetical protein
MSEQARHLYIHKCKSWDKIPIPFQKRKIEKRKIFISKNRLRKIVFCAIMFCNISYSKKLNNLKIK